MDIEFELKHKETPQRTFLALVMHVVTDDMALSLGMTPEEAARFFYKAEDAANIFAKKVLELNNTTEEEAKAAFERYLSEAENHANNPDE